MASKLWSWPSKKSLDLAGLNNQRRREVVRKRAGDHLVRLLCRTLGCPRVGLYRTPSADDEADRCRAVERLAGVWPTYGYRRITAMLR